MRVLLVFICLLLPLVSCFTPYAQKHTLFIGTANGQVHAFDPQTHRVRWTIDTDSKPLFSSFSGQSVPEDVADRPFGLIPGTGNALYAVDAAEGTVTRVNEALPSLVASTPVVTDQKMLLLGSKSSKILALSPKTGRIAWVLGGGEDTLGVGPSAGASMSDEQLLSLRMQAILREARDSGADVADDDDDVILVGRTDYSLAALESTTGELMWNVSSGDLIVAAASSRVNRSAPVEQPEDDVDTDIIDVISTDYGLVLRYNDVEDGSKSTDADHHMVAVLGSPAVVVYAASPEVDDAGTGVDWRVVRLPTPRRLTRATSDLQAPPSASLVTQSFARRSSDGIFLGQVDGEVYVCEAVVDTGSVDDLDGDDDDDDTIDIDLDQMPYVASDDDGGESITGEENVCVIGNLNDFPTCALGYRTLAQASTELALVSYDSSLVVTPSSGPSEVALYEDLRRRSPFELVGTLIGGLVVMAIVRLATQATTRLEEARPRVTRVNGTSVTIGNLSYNREEVLGYGSAGTVVYRGELHGRRVAVKRLLADFAGVASDEVSLLLDADEHPNVVQYFATEQDEAFVYVALSYCVGTLGQLWDREPPINPTRSNKVRILNELLSGLAYLHKLAIVHRDLKPHNVLVSPAGNIQITDMGLARRVRHESSSFSLALSPLQVTAARRRAGVVTVAADEGEGEEDAENAVAEGVASWLGGSAGWQAPEVLALYVAIADGSELADQVRPSRKVDLFSLGCLIYFVLTDGHHPFGEGLDRQSRILAGTSTFTDLDGRDGVYADTTSLVRACVSASPADRPDAASLRTHPALWTPTKRLQFLRDASDRLEFDKASSFLVRMLEEDARSVVGSDWSQRFTDELIDDLGRYRNYNTRTVRDLLRVIRNKAHHYRDLPFRLQKVLGELPDAYLAHFETRFPRLLLHVHTLVLQYCSKESWLDPYR